MVESAPALVRRGGAPAVRAGELFHEPDGEVVTRFDAGEEGVVFLGWLPPGPGQARAADAAG